MPLWQFALVLATQAFAWFIAGLTIDRRAARREALRAVLDQKLTDALRDLFEQRGRHEGCGPECSEMHTETGRCEIARNR